MTFLQSGIYALLYTIFTLAMFEVFSSEIHPPSQVAGMVFVFALFALDKYYGRERELARRKWIDEEYERRFGVKNEPEPDEGGPE